MNAIISEYMAVSEGTEGLPGSRFSELSTMDWALVASHAAASGNHAQAEQRYQIALLQAGGDVLSEAQVLSMRALTRFESSGTDVYRLLSAVADYHAAGDRLVSLNGEVQVQEAREALEQLREKMLEDSRLTAELLGESPTGDRGIEDTRWDTREFSRQEVEAVADKIAAEGWPFRPSRERSRQIGGWALDAAHGGTDPPDERTTDIMHGNTYMNALKFHGRFKRGR